MHSATLSELTLITIHATLHKRRSQLIDRLIRNDQPHCREKKAVAIQMDRQEVARIDSALSELPAIQLAI